MIISNFNKKRTTISGFFLSAAIAFAFLQYFIEGLALHKLMIELDVSNARLSKLLKLQNSGELDLKIAQWFSLAVFFCGLVFVKPILTLHKKSYLPIISIILFLLVATFNTIIVDPDQLIPQVGRCIRYVNALFILPALTFIAARKVGSENLVALTSFVFYVGYLFCAISILMDLIGSKAIAEVGFRYSVLLGSATAQAVLFCGAIAAVFLFRGVPEYRDLSRAIRIPMETLTCATALAIIVLTGSRGPFVAMAACGIAYAIIQAKRNLTLTFIIILSPFFVLWLAQDGQILEYFKGREGLDISTGRTEIWTHTIAQVRDLTDFIFGYKADLAPHNTFLGLLITYGFIALLIFIIFQLQLFSRTIRLVMLSARNSEIRELSARMLAVEIGVLTYGMYENFFYLNNGLLMLIYYFLFGVGLLFYSLTTRKYREYREHSDVRISI